MIAAREITVTTLRHLTSSSNQNDSNLSNDCPPDRKSSTVVAVQEWIPKNFPSWATASQPSTCPSVVSLTKERVQTATVKKMDMRHLEFPQASFDGLWVSFSLLHIRASDIEQTLSGFRKFCDRMDFCLPLYIEVPKRNGLRQRFLEWNAIPTCKNGSRLRLKIFSGPLDSQFW